jgi:hypothetical protein
MGSYEILDLSSSNKWNSFLKRLPIEQQDVYFTPEYYRLYEELGDGKAKCFVFEEGQNIALYPFLINSVNELGYNLDKEYYDIQGAYGYNGVLTSSFSPPFLKTFFNCFDEYCKQNKIVAEFLRINPVLHNPLLHRTNFELIYDRDNINVNLLNNNIFEIEYEYATRKNIRKAIINGLTFKAIKGNEISHFDLEVFTSIYNEAE